MQDQEQKEKRYKRIWKDLEMAYRKKSNVYQDIRDLLAPGTGLFERTDNLENDSIDYKKLLDAEPVTYLDTTVAGLYGGLINPATRWFDITVDKTNKELRSLDFQTITENCATTKEILYYLFAKTNFYSAMRNVLNEFVRYGFGVMLIEERDWDFIMFNPLTVGECYLGIDENGRHTKLARKMLFTADKLVAEFGYDKCPERVQECYNKGDYAKAFVVKHLICENDKSGFVADRFKYVDIYWIEGQGGFNLLRKSGFVSNPIAVFCWDRKNLRTIYPMGLGEKMLGDMKELQHTVRCLAMNKSYLENPALALHSSLGKKALVPGARFYTDQDPAKVAAEIFRVNSYIGELEDSRARILDKLNKMSYAQILMLFAQKDRAAMTATEANAIVSEQMTLLAPIYLQAKEGLDAVFKRVLDICERRGLFEEAGFSSKDLKLEFVSSIAKAQRMAEVSSIQELVQYIAALAQIKPGANDYINEDKIIIDVAERLGNAHFLRSQEEVAQIRQAQAEQQQAIMDIQMQAERMKMMKDAAKAEIKQNNMLGQQVLQQGGTIPPDPKDELERQKAGLMPGGF